VLSMILANTGFTFKKIDEDLIVITNNDVDGAQVPIRGRVTDPEGNPLPGVTVALEGSRTQTATNSAGEFSLNAPANGKLTFSSVGFATQTIDINNREQVIIVMRSDSKGLDEVVVIGYGTRRKKDVTGAISTTVATEI